MPDADLSSPYADPAETAPAADQPELPDLCTREALVLDQLSGETRVSIDAIIPGAKRADADLVRNIAEIGILQPVVLQATPGEDARYRILYGERRVDAARRAGHADVPARVYPVEAPVDADVLALIENWLRRPNFARELRAVNALVQRGYKAARLARDLGKPIGTVKRYVRLCALPPVLLEAAMAGRLTQGLATEIIKLPVPDREALATRFVEQGRVTADDVRARREVRRDAITAALPAALFGDDEDLATLATATPRTTPGGIPVADERRAVAVGLTAGEVRRLVERLDPAADGDLRGRLEAALFAQGFGTVGR